MKPRWQSELEAGVQQLDAEVTRRKTMSTTDPVADGIAYATAEFKTRIATVTAPGRELTPAEWGAEQDPPLAEQTVRNWIKDGRLDARLTAKGYRILASARARDHAA